MFLSIDSAITAIKAAIQGGLGPIALISNPQALLKAFPAELADLIIQLSATLILFIAIRFLFWKPITNILEARRAAIDKELEEAKIAKENAVQVEEELKYELDRAKAEIKEMLDQAEKEANLKREEIVNSAKEEARRRMDNLKIELEQEKKNMESDIKKEIVDVAFKAAEKIVSREIDQDKYLDVVEDILKGGC
jgi:F-type H+-transporting ATPase subunit b